MSIPMATPTESPLVAPVAQRGPLPRAARQESILWGAARAFARTGYAATSMEDIAAASGITKLIVYRHFASKDVLVLAFLMVSTIRYRTFKDAGLNARTLLIFLVVIAPGVARAKRERGLAAIGERQARASQVDQHHDRIVPVRALVSEDERPSATSRSPPPPSRAGLRRGADA